ncbi:transcriptional regulator [Colwellia sp. MSW7]|jgi:sigma-E factor negative regulatory protein RseA|uniref:Anti-sigma-E factor RseA n=1 Tax=Colwellia maritima TaxID=2912588 RepID=A0ABS9X2K8_9GAMM|nr:RseA family anti-sigma factor [Colwellia maritima]MCI2283277.1 transcriptional regulator [Colwellia maritima]
MSESKFETISSMVDNYRNSDQASEQTIDDMLKDEDLANTWHNYHLIGDVMRNEIPDTLQLDLSAEISAAIAEEPTILAPSTSSSKASGGFKAKIIQLMKPVGQLAIAASAAGLMIVGVQQNTAETDEIITPSQIVQTTPLGGFANPVSFNYQQNTQSQQEAALEQRIEQQRRFQALLSDHQQQIKLSAAKATDDNNSVIKTEVGAETRVE